MAISTTSNKVVNQGNGVNTVFNFNFTVRQSSDIVCTYVDANGNETDVTANCVIALNAVAVGAQWAVGGTVTYNPGGVPIAAGTQLVVLRIMPFTQVTAFANQGGQFPAVTEQTADMLEMVVQQVNEILSRTPAITRGKDASLYTLTLNPVANALLGWDATGKVLGTVAGTGTNVVLPGAAGIAVYSGGSSFISRTLTGDATITVANGSGTAGNPTVSLAASAVSAAKLATSAMGFSMINGTLVPSQNATQLTVAIKTLAGADPSAIDPVYVLFRNVNAGTGDFTVITLTAANSIQTTVGGTFGVANGVSFRLWVVGFNDGGVFRLGLINCLSTVANSGTGRNMTALFPLAGWGIASSTLIGAGSTLSQTFYSAGAGVASKAYATLGWLSYEAGLAVAGTFGINQSRTHLHGLNDPLPGHVIQIQRNEITTGVNGTTAFGVADAIPQNTAGDQYGTQAITPSSATNVLRLRARLGIQNNIAAGDFIGMGLFQDAVANGLTATVSFMLSQNRPVTALDLDLIILASTSAATTFKMRAGCSSGGLGITSNGSNAAPGARTWGGVANSFMEAQEIMA